MYINANSGLLTIHKALFLHSPDCEFAEVGAKSDIPYRHWFNMFKEFLMKNTNNPEIEALFEWWNGKVFTFDTTNNRGVGSDDVESGMDEAELVLAGAGPWGDFSDSEMVPLSAQHENNNNEEDLIQVVTGTLNLTIDDGSNQPLSSQTVADSSSESRLDPEQLLEPVVVQPDKSATQNAGKPGPKRPSTKKADSERAKSSGKGKQKAVFLDEPEADLEAEGLDGTGTVKGKSLRSRRK
jgi:hypothetical protein